MAKIGENAFILASRDGSTMPRFAANVSMMFNEHDPMDRLAHAASLGFQYVEWLFPYSCEKRTIASKLEELSLKLILINAAAGDGKRGDRGIGALPERQSEFKSAMTQAIDYARTLNVPYIHVMAGQCPNLDTRQHYLNTFAANLTWASKQLDNGSPQLLVEPLNRFDVPNYLISTTDEALELMDLADANIGLQFDFYHLQIMEGNLSHTISKHIDRIAHVQFSSLPGRHEPQYGEVNCAYLFSLLDSLSYQGYVGCEYRPKESLAEGLSWGRPYGIGYAES